LVWQHPDLHVDVGAGGGGLGATGNQRGGTGVDKKKTTGQGKDYRQSLKGSTSPAKPNSRGRNQGKERSLKLSRRVQGKWMLARENRSSSAQDAASACRGKTLERCSKKWQGEKGKKEVVCLLWDPERAREEHKVTDKGEGGILRKQTTYGGEREERR